MSSLRGYGRQHSDQSAPSGSGRKRGVQKEGFGRSKGGFTRKLHLISNAFGLPVRAEVTGGEVSDDKGYDSLYDEEQKAAKILIADRGYDSDHIRQNTTGNGGTTVIPTRKNRKVQVPVDHFIYALRNQMERCFNKLKIHSASPPDTIKP